MVVLENNEDLYSAKVQNMMGALDEVHPIARAYLCEVGLHLWTKAYFPGHKYNIMTTNIVKLFNVLVKHTQGLPIFMWAEFI